MPKKKTLVIWIFCLSTLGIAGNFFFMKHDRQPAPVSLIPGEGSLHPHSETFASVPIPSGVTCTRILVQKSSRALTLYRNKEALKTYRISLGGNPLGHKEFEGDQKTPEGVYWISGRNPQSSYHLSLRISYPDEKDVLHAAALGKTPGNDIMIHGWPNESSEADELYLLTDWTAGCLAVNNAEMEEIWRVSPDGTAIEIRP